MELARSGPFWGAVSVIVIVLSALLLFREPISVFLKNVKRARFGKDMVDLSSGDAATQDASTDTGETEVSDKEYEEEKKEDTKGDAEDAERSTYVEWRTELFIAAIITQDRDRLEYAYTQMLKYAEDDLTKKKAKVIYLQMKQGLGNNDALVELKSISGDIDVQFEVNMALGHCYVNANDFKRAISHYEIAQTLALGDEEKTSLAGNYASALYRDGQKETAITLLGEMISRVESDPAKGELYAELGKIYENEDDYENRAFVMDKALALKPGNTGLLFDAAYAYSKSGYEELSLLHYVNAKRINPKDSSVRNNLAVQYDNLKMPFRSVENYKKAEEEGSTLASANLAYRLMGAGFETEATEILDAAKVKEDVHPNVGSAVSEIAKRKDAEDDTEKKVTKRALVQRKFFLEFADARHIPGALLEAVSGNWTSDSEIPFSIEVKDGVVTGIWIEPGFGDYVQEFKFEGLIQNNSSKLLISRKEYNAAYERVYKSKGKGGYLFATSDVQMQLMIIGEYGEKKVLHLKRV